MRNYNKKFWIKIIIILLLGGIYFLYINSKRSKTNLSNTQNTSSQSNKDNAQNGSIAQYTANTNINVNQNEQNHDKNNFVEGKETEETQTIVEQNDLEENKNIEENKNEAYLFKRKRGRF